MGGALQGFGTPSVYPTQPFPWGLSPQLSGQIGGPLGSHVPQQLQQLQATIHQLLQTQFVQQQQLQQLVQIVPQQLQQIHHLIQFVAQQAYQTSPLHVSQPFLPYGGYVPSFGAQSGWLATSPATQPQIFGGQGGFGAQGGYVM